MGRLILFDMDGTLFEHKNIWLELHKRLGTWEAGEKATQEWLYKDYERLVDIVIHALWKGKPAQPFLDLVAETRYVPGAEATVRALKARGHEIALISSGPTHLLQRAMDELGIEHGIANRLDIEDGIITGKSRNDDGSTMWPVQADRKVPAAERLCEELGFRLEECVAIGDERNDLPLFESVGMSIAFNAHDAELKKAATRIVEGNDLRMILEFL